MRLRHSLWTTRCGAGVRRWGALAHTVGHDADDAGLRPRGVDIPPLLLRCAGRRRRCRGHSRAGNAAAPGASCIQHGSCPPHSAHNTTSHSSGVLLRHHLICRRLPWLAQVVFDVGTLSIPDVSYRTARFLGVPLLPIFRIAVVPKSLQVDCAAAAVAASHPLDWTSAVCIA